MIWDRSLSFTSLPVTHAECYLGGIIVYRRGSAPVTYGISGATASLTHCHLSYDSTHRELPSCVFVESKQVFSHYFCFCLHRHSWVSFTTTWWKRPGITRRPSHERTHKLTVKLIHTTNLATWQQNRILTTTSRIGRKTAVQVPDTRTQLGNKMTSIQTMVSIGYVKPFTSFLWLAKVKQLFLPA